MPLPFINLAIVDDHTLLRKTLKNYISEQKNMKVVIQSPDIPDLLNKLKNTCIHVLIMDIFMPKLNGHEAVSLVRSEYPDIKILIMSMCTDTDMEVLSDMLDLGVYGVISKGDEPEEIIRAIISLSEQRIYRNKLFTDVMYWNKQHSAKMYNTPVNVLLNEREREILKLLWEEKSNKDIADHLFLSVRSVEKIRQDMKEKLGIKSTVGLLKYALNERIIRIEGQWSRNLHNVENSSQGL